MQTTSIWKERFNRERDNVSEIVKVSEFIVWELNCLLWESLLSLWSYLIRTAISTVDNYYDKIMKILFFFYTFLNFLKILSKDLLKKMLIHYYIFVYLHFCQKNKHTVRSCWRTDPSGAIVVAFIFNFLRFMCCFYLKVDFFYKIFKIIKF